MYEQGKNALASGHYNDALNHANALLAQDPNHTEALWLRIDALDQLHRYEDVASATLALPPSIPRNATFLTEQARVLLQAKHYVPAIQSALLALRLEHHNPLAQVHLAMALTKIHRLGDAIVCLEAALKMNPPEEAKLFIQSQLVYTLRHAICWRHLDVHSTELMARVAALPEDAADQVNAFFLLALNDDPALQLRQARRISRHASKGITPLDSLHKPRASKPVRIGYLSSYFGNTPCMQLMRGMLKMHTKNVDVTFYNHSRPDGSALQQEILALPHRIVNVHRVDNRTIAQQIKNDDVDILIDLNGYTDENRHAVFAYKPAPLQLTMVGYPGTSGAPYIDYILGDRVVTPEEHQKDFQECIAQMPHCYLPTDNTLAPVEPLPRTYSGLPSHGVVYCCFNQLYKITPSVANAWSEILHQVPDSVLWLLEWNNEGPIRLRHEMAMRGIDPSRLIFSPLMSPLENQARLQAADLFLDTWPYNGHTTASEALWGGVPVLTHSGNTFASRVAASLVHGCGLPELHCVDTKTYVERGIEWGLDTARLQTTKNMLLTNRTTLPAFDTQRYTHDFETLLHRMVERHRAGLPPTFLAAQA